MPAQVAGVALDVVYCPDRRIDRAVLEVVADEVGDGRTEVSVLIPRREYRRFWHRFLHDCTADEIAEAIARIPHANVTLVPYHFGTTEVPAAYREALHHH